MSRRRLAVEDALALAGVVTIDVGCWQIWHPLAWLWGGLVLLVAGIGATKKVEPPV